MSYNLHMRAREPFILRSISSVRLPQNLHALDIGCGLGFFTVLMLELGLKVVALDIDLRSLSKAREVSSQKSELIVSPDGFVCADAVSPPFANESFDIILATEIIEHLRDENDFFHQVRRLLKSDGTLVLTTVCRNGGLRISNRFLHTEGGEKHHKQWYFSWEIRKLLEQNAFIVEDISYAFSSISRILMECIKIFYRIKGGRYQSQTDVFKVSNSLVFRTYKAFFPFLMILNTVDGLLTAFIRGDIIMIRAKKTEYL